MDKKKPEKFEFKTEVKQILDLVIHSLYSHKDIFLRELISNASDAIDKRKFQALTNPQLSTDYQIKIESNENESILKISDNGIGMNKDELSDNLGTIARSGTKDFLEQLKEQNKDNKNNPELIGKFGVGFYSAFMVAKKIEVISRKIESENAYKWSSKGEGGFEITEHDKSDIGTEIILYISEENKEYLEEHNIKKIIKKYSDFVEHPILMDTTKDEYPKKEDGTTDYEATPAKITEEEKLNSQKAIWIKNSSEISEEEYTEFYKHLSHDYNNPLKTIHYSAEGTIEFKALLYIPSKSPFNIYQPENKKGIQLYVRRVFIMDNYETLVPEYLRFVKGVVDSNDLPLNVSREILQQDKQLEKIKKNVTKKILNALKQMKEKEIEEYIKFYNQFGSILKEGIHYDYENKEILTELLMYKTTKSDNKLKSLGDYIDNMVSEQKDIYYLLANNEEEAKKIPVLEAFQQKGYEVILMTDTVDDWVVGSMNEYKDKKIIAIDKGNVDISNEEEKKDLTKKQEEYKSLLDFMNKQLAETVKEVKFSNRLTGSVSCLVNDEHAISKNMEQMFKAMGQAVPAQKKILELNANHNLVSVLKKEYEKNSSSELLKNYTDLIYQQALIAEGNRLVDPVSFTKKVSDLMLKAIEK
jgi:molecular chaperone HtpG